VPHLSNSIRNTRYNVKSSGSITLIIGTTEGENIEFEVLDCSLNGICALCEKDKLNDEIITTSTIIPNAKLKSPKSEHFLGRLSVRRIELINEKWEIAFSTIDTKIPTTESLSHFFDIDLTKTNNREELNPNQFSLAHFAETEFSNIDLFDRINKFSVFHREWSATPKYGYYTIRTESMGPRVNLARARKGGRKDYLVMGSNDYLGLGSHPEVIQACKNALDKYGANSTGSPVSTGLTDLHVELCETVAKIHKKESTLLFNSGYAANIGAITALTSPNDLIIADQLCHASIQEAMQMSKANIRFFKHNSIEHLVGLLKKERENYNGCLIITEGVFSMDGNTSLYNEIYAVARQYNARIYVDQAHCFGVIGPNGFGITEKFNLAKETDVIMGTFSKICGGIGGFITGSKDLIEWLRCFSKSQLFSVSLAPSTVAGVSKALELFLKDKSLLENLKRNINHFTSSLKILGFDISPHHESAIISIVIGDEKKLGEMYQSLLDDGIWCTPVVYPVVGRKKCRFRFTIMANHTTSDLDYVVNCLEKAMIKSGYKPTDASVVRTNAA
jgi:glycine C-acetyltransferase